MSTDDHWFYRPLRKVHRTELQLPNEVVAHLRMMAATAYPKETGGLLLGWWDGGIPTICAAVEVPDPRAGRSQWRRREEAAAVVLTAAIKEANDPDIGYVGDWHSHPMDIGPSRVDSNNLRRISRQYSEAVVLAVVRHCGPIDTRLAKDGSLTTLGSLRSTQDFGISLAPRSGS